MPVVPPVPSASSVSASGTVFKTDCNHIRTAQQRNLLAPSTCLACCCSMRICNSPACKPQRPRGCSYLANSQCKGTEPQAGTGEACDSSQRAHACVKSLPNPPSYGCPTPRKHPSHGDLLSRAAERRTASSQRSPAQTLAGRVRAHRGGRRSRSYSRRPSRLRLRLRSFRSRSSSLRPRSLSRSPAPRSPRSRSARLRSPPSRGRWRSRSVLSRSLLPWSLLSSRALRPTFSISSPLPHCYSLHPKHPFCKPCQT